MYSEIVGIDQARNYLHTTSLTTKIMWFSQIKNSKDSMNREDNGRYLFQPDFGNAIPVLSSIISK